MNRPIHGFHLIELLIVLSIMGILLAFTIPHYTSHITRERRLEAQTVLMKMASAMEIFYAKHHTYEEATLTTIQIPEFIAQDSYRLAIQSQRLTDFEIVAIPQQKQAQEDRQCGTLFLNSQGAKGISGYGSVRECWSF